QSQFLASHANRPCSQPLTTRPPSLHFICCQYSSCRTPHGIAWKMQHNTRMQSTIPANLTCRFDCRSTWSSRPEPGSSCAGEWSTTSRNTKNEAHDPTTALHPYEQEEKKLNHRHH